MQAEGRVLQNDRCRGADFSSDGSFLANFENHLSEGRGAFFERIDVLFERFRHRDALRVGFLEINIVVALPLKPGFRRFEKLSKHVLHVRAFFPNRGR